MDNGVAGKVDSFNNPITPKYPGIEATNYDSTVNKHNPSLCQYGTFIEGCMDRGKFNPFETDINGVVITPAKNGWVNTAYDSTAQVHNASMCDAYVEVPTTCDDPNACNFGKAEPCIYPLRTTGFDLSLIHI